MPESGIGFYTYDDRDEQYGALHVIAALIAFAAQWNETHPSHPLGIGEISLDNGNSRPPHKAHKNGLNVDIRPMTFNGGRAGTAYNRGDGTYNAALTRELIQGLMNLPEVSGIIFNDATMGTMRDKAVREGRSRTGIHDNHLHVIFRP